MRINPVGQSFVKLLMAMAAWGSDSAVASDVEYTSNVTLQTGNTPTLTVLDSRHPQIWKVSSNHTGFYLKSNDAGNIQTRLRIDKGAPSGSFYMDSHANLGIGTSVPAGQLHVVKPALPGPETIALFHVTDANPAWLAIGNASPTNGVFVPRIQGLSQSTNLGMYVEGTIAVDSGTNPAIVFNAALISGGGLANRSIFAFQNNTVTKARIAADGAMFAHAFQQSSSRALKDRIVELASLKATQGLRQLTPVQFRYKADEAGQRHAGFIADDVPDIVAHGDRASVPVPDVVALVTRVAKDHVQTLDRQKATVDGQRKLAGDQQRTIESLKQVLDEQQKSIQDYREAGLKQQKLIDEFSKRLAGLEERVQKKE